jgi:hypothetical protein
LSCCLIASFCSGVCAALDCCFLKVALAVVLERVLAEGGLASAVAALVLLEGPLTVEVEALSCLSLNLCIALLF